MVNRYTQHLKLALSIIFLFFFMLSAKAQWVSKNNGLYGGDISALAVNGNNIFAGTDYGGVFLSTNNGSSWTAVNTGLTDLRVNTLAISGNNIFEGTSSGIFLSTNNGSTWTAVNTGLTDLWVNTLAISGNNIFAGTSSGVFLSTNNGSTWTAANTGLTNTRVITLAISGSNIFVGTYGGVFLSTNNGTSWTAVNIGLTNNNVRTFAVSGSNIFAGTDDGKVCLSTNNGNSWIAVKTILAYGVVNALAISGSNIFAGLDYGGVFLSTNNGSSWTAVNTGLTNTNVNAFAISGSNIFAGTDVGVFLSTNIGSSWTAVNTGLTNAIVSDFAISGGNIFAGTGVGVFLSTNNGSTWTAASTGLRFPKVTELAISGSNIFAGTSGDGIYLSTNNGSSWTNVMTGAWINALAISGSNIFAGIPYGGVFLSTNNGSTWTAVNTGLTDTRVITLAISGSNIFAGTVGGVFLSTNNGSSWTAVGLTNTNVRAFAISGNNIFAGTGEGVFLSTNNGSSWTAVNTGLTYRWVNTLAISGSNIFAGSFYGGVFLSTNNGGNWSEVNRGLTNTRVFQLAISNSEIFSSFDRTGVWSRSLTDNFTTDDNTPPVLDADNTPNFVSYDNIINNTGIPINALFSDPLSGVANDSVKVIYRSVTNLDIEKPLTLSKPGPGQNWTNSIPASDIGELGVEYRLQATNGAGLVTHIPSATTYKLIRVQHSKWPIPYSSYGTSATNYRMISIPLDLDAASVNNIFSDELGPYDKFKWRLFQYKTTTTELNGSSALKAGEGYWLIAKDNPGYPLTTGHGLTVTATKDNPFKINLQAGWNQIGNPYNFNLAWSDILTANTFLKDKNAQLRVYDGTSDYPVSSVLYKGQGGFVRVPSATILTFPVTKNKDVNSGRINQEVQRNKNPIDADNWEVMISLRQGDKLNTYSGIGMQPDASLSFDKYDGFTVPRFIEYLELNHDKTHLKDHFAKDIIPTAPEHTWSFEVASSDNNEPASLNWNNELLGDNEKELFLVDEQEGISINMRMVNTYSFQPPRRFKIIYGNSEYLSKEMPEGVPKIVSVNPNPSRGDMKLLISLPEWNKVQPVKIDVINLQGQAVASVYSGSLISGSHELLWNGMNKEGERPAQGVYFLRMMHTKGQSVFRIVMVN